MVGALPVGRAGHCGAVVAGRVVVCCGESALGPLDSVLLITTDFGAELKPVARQLLRLAGVQGLGFTAPADRAGFTALADAAAKV